MDTVLSWIEVAAFSRKTISDKLSSQLLVLKLHVLVKTADIKRLWHMRFPVNFAKFVRTPFFRPSGRSFTLRGHNFFKKVQFQGHLKQRSLEQDPGHNTK